MLGSSKTKLTFKSLTINTWKDFETLFGDRGACGGCWCMSWRLSRADFEKKKGDGNKRAIKKLVDKNEQIGVISYLNGKPIGWCAVAPREKYIKLEDSRVLKRIDNEPVWSITCFFLAKEFRCKGYSVELLKGVIGICKKKKVKILEAYPILPYSDNMPAAFAWTGFLSSFKKAGFRIAKRWSEARPIMRYYL
ncbi:MAG: GNAT family N-acetyltransferase [Ignavibacteriales bacterium]|nr:GNAT family N-acetyltransferase [Ignavibacteriales bacterium]